jgi:hypothetical protein
MQPTCLPSDSKIVGNITIGDNIKCDVWDYKTGAEADNKIITQTDSPVLVPIQSVSTNKNPETASFMYFFNAKHFTDVYPDVKFFFFFLNLNFNFLN